ncbi:PREDICTED: uncharacterized protein LOC104761770 isoform X1 [Camelina sativa]|uniref:Uncharacterized protein LOC104761770 isoform X1 n=1 Tax=Camelina sativa TaxID=90675 RepID=A0ABM1R8Q5_CAMSA|nr:PREDICTED: uncharacterized protein LOC104761770 isoform X1 [Camelina sativa]
MISESVAFSASKLVDHKQRSLVNFSGIDGDDDETGDLTKKVDVDRSLDGADCVLHLASYVYMFSDAGFPSLVNLLAKMLSWLSGSLKEVARIVPGLFEDSRYKSESKKPSLKSVDIIGFGTGPALEKKLKYDDDVSYGVIFGRELTNSPANVLTLGMDGLKHYHVLWFVELSYSILICFCVLYV